MVYIGAKIKVSAGLCPFGSSKGQSMSLPISVSSLPEFSVWLLLFPSSNCVTRTRVSVVPSHSLPSSLLPPLDKAPVIALGLAW